MIMLRFCFWFFCLIVLLLSCGEKSEDGTSKTQGDKYTVSIEKPIEIPDDFPSDVYIYPRSTAIDVAKTPKGYSLTLSTSHDVPRVAETYKRQMMIKGWTAEASVTKGAESFFAYTKGERVANVAINPAEGGIRIKLTVTVD
jgi:hypothetical protein